MRQGACFTTDGTQSFDLTGKVYVFRTCINVVLSRDPVTLLRVTDVKELIEEATPAVPTQTLLDEFRTAPAPRQEDILRFLMSVALDSTQSEIVQQNAL